jgi:hypothetical protein
VSDKFAGKSGPCPHCKTVIRVPTKEEEVKVQEPEAAPPGARGAPAPKPILRTETKATPVGILLICVSALVVLIVTAVLGRAEFFVDGAVLKSAIGLLLVSPPLVVAGYSFLRDDEDLSPYRGKVLYLRAAICSVLYIALWGVYSYLSGRVLTGELWTWVYVVPPFLVVGASAALATLDLDFGSGFFHYCFYLFATVLLRWLAGLGWVWQIAEEPLL